jgi:predicted phosphodiesterase
MPDRYAILADIHGNRWALEAVLADVRRRGIDHIVNLGDSLYGPLDPDGTADMLVPLELPTVRGNEDRIITETGDESDTIRFVHARLRPGHIEWLKGLPVTMVAFGELFLCHGTPRRDDEYLLRVVTASGVADRSHSEISAVLGDVPCRVVLCAHDHVPAVVRLAEGGRLVLNPGSVGLPAYTDDTPYPHAMETGSPHARYAVLTRSGDGWQAERVAVPYDWSAAAAAAERTGRADWATWLETGRARATK